MKEELIIRAEVSQPSCWKAELSSLLTQQRTQTHTLTCTRSHARAHVSSFPCSFFTHHLLPPLPPLWWMEGMNSPQPPRVSLWGPRQLNKQHALNLKAQSGIYWNHVRSGYICVWSWSAREETWKIDFCNGHDSKHESFIRSSGYKFQWKEK